MCHPLYPLAQRLVGRPVNAYHVNGRVYRGILHSANPQGVYLLNPNAAYVSMNTDEAGPAVSHAVDSPSASASMELTYSPAAYFGFGALTGLTLGALAGGWYW